MAQTIHKKETSQGTGEKKHRKPQGEITQIRKEFQSVQRILPLAYYRSHRTQSRNISFSHRKFRTCKKGGYQHAEDECSKYPVDKEESTIYVRTINIARFGLKFVGYRL